jgi:subtilisin family serine protease
MVPDAYGEKRKTMRPPLRGRFLFGACLALIAVIRATSAMAGVVPEALYDKVAREGSVRVIVQFRVATTAEGELESADAVASQRQDIAAMRYAALAELAGTSHRTIREFATIPFVALEVAPDAMAALEASPNVVGVEEDRLERASLSQSVPLIGANQAWAAGFDGTGIVVAILDTGIDKTHPFLSGKVVEEACFSVNDNCPNGMTSQIGPGAAEPCTYAANGCRHGTHVAGIAAGAGTSFSGVAKGAGIIAVQVFSRFTGSSCAGGEDPCALSSVSDQIAGLEHVFSLRSQFTIAAVNLSLGGGKFTSPCDSGQAARKAAIDNLRSVGIATAAASGNDGFTDSLNAPGCISTAVSVGSTTKSDAVSSFSNSASFLSLLAPGQSITSSVPGGGFAVGSGTSAATPHVAGAWAILKQKKPTATVDEVLTALRNTGFLITDFRNNVTTPRIRVDQALQAVATSHSLTITGGPSGSPNPVASGGTANLSVSATDSLGHGLSYAWTASCPTLPSNGGFSNAALPTPAWTAPPNMTGSQQSCTMQVTVSDSQGLNQVGSYAQGVSVPFSSARLVNISTRGRVETGDNVMIGGFIIAGDSPKIVLVRAVGPSLTGFGVPGALANPTLQLFAGQTPIAENNDWQVSLPLCQQSGHTCGTPADIAATGLAPSQLAESALLITLAPGPYTAIVRGVGGTTGVGLVEVFGVDANSAARLVNLSTRGRVETGDNVMIGGFIIGGNSPKTLLVRAVGPSLAAFGVPGVLADPVLRLFAGQTPIAENDDWQVTFPLCQQSGHTCGGASAIASTGLAPNHPLEAAILITLPPGPYTVIVSGFAGTTGVGLVEVFEVTATPGP